MSTMLCCANEKTWRCLCYPQAQIYDQFTFPKPLLKPWGIKYTHDHRSASTGVFSLAVSQFISPQFLASSFLASSSECLDGGDPTLRGGNSQWIFLSNVLWEGDEAGGCDGKTIRSTLGASSSYSLWVSSLLDKCCLQYEGKYHPLVVWSTA